MNTNYSELVRALRDMAQSERDAETMKLLFEAACELEHAEQMCAAAAAKQKLLRLAQLTEEAEALHSELYEEWFSYCMDYQATKILTGCTIDDEGLKDAEGNLLSRDGRCMDEPFGYFVNQSCGYCEDDYYGTMYVSIDDKGTFVAVDYQC